MTDDDFAFADLATLERALDAGTTTAVALTQLFLGRLDTIGRRLNAVVALDAGSALRAAEASDQRRGARRKLGALDGIPFAVKDNIDTAPPLPTTLGVVRFAGRQAASDAEVIVRLKAAGAILLGKLALMEMMAMLPFETFDASATGPARNPYDPNAWTGDSSTGSAIAVAAGCVPFALATETRGSIIQPAGFCGIFGLRPTVGVVPGTGSSIASPTFDRIGPMTRTASDALKVHRVLSGNADGDRAPQRPRIGLLKPVPGADPEIAANFATLARRLSTVCDVTEAVLPDLPFADCFKTILTQEGRAAFAPFIADGTVAGLISPLARDGSYLAGPIDAVALANALHARGRLEAAFLDWLSPFDAVLAVTNPRVAPTHSTTLSEWFGNDDSEPITTVGALLGLPALSIPCGLGAGLLPVGVQFVGRAHSEPLLAELAEVASARLPTIRAPRWAEPTSS